MTYVVLIQFTEQGIKHIKESPQRAAAFRSQIEGSGGEVVQLFWTLGQYDGVLVMDMPDEATATAALLRIAAQGYIRTEALRAFETEEFQSIVAKT